LKNILALEVEYIKLHTSSIPSGGSCGFMAILLKTRLHFCDVWQSGAGNQV